MGRPTHISRMEQSIQLNKVSVVIPMYNSENTIERAITSILNQTYKGLIEIIVVNDGSKDNSQHVVEQFIVNNPNRDINLINQQNGGVSKARNTGLKNVSGDLIALLDADDAWFKEKLEVQINYLLKSDADFVCGLRNNEVITFPYDVKDNYTVITLKKLLIKVVGQTSTALFKKKILQNTGFFDENQRYSEDANYWMRISIKNKMIIINEKVVYTDNDYGQSGLSSNYEGMEEGVQKNVKEMYDIKQINYFEYLFFKGFSKFKYIIRKLRK